jgi:flagellar biosynthesis protein FlhA
MKNLKLRWQDIFLPLGIIACLMVIFVPLPTPMMDFLLAANIAIAVLVLFGTIFVKSPLEFAIFPSLILATTFSRIALNIATTRLILSRGAIDGESAAGEVVASFASFVTGDSLIIGLVIFSIIVVIQFVVITKGASRISEVAARFALDGLPGRQMAIDAELNAGTINGEQAQRMRAETIDHADFYGAMDGASKFVRGDAVAGLFIMIINLVGGLAIGLYQNMPVQQAINTFSKLTIGDGLVSQLPALILSLAAALLITRSTRKVDLSQEMIHQVFGRPMVLALTAVFLLMLVITNLPKIPLLILAGGCATAAFMLSKNDQSQSRTSTEKMGRSTESKGPAPNPEWSIDKLLSSELMEMELGRGLIRLADAGQGGELLTLVNKARQQLAFELGVILPKIRIRDNLSIATYDFQILVQGNVVNRGTIDPNLFLAIDRGKATAPISSDAVQGLASEGFFEWPAFWIDPAAYESSVANGYDVLTAEEVLAEQLKRSARLQAPMILTRDATKQLIDELQRRSPAVVDDLIPGQLSLAQVQQILKSLLDEEVSIRPLELILETLGDNAKLVHDRWELVEKVRLRLGRHITSRLIDTDSATLLAYSIEDSLQDRIAAGCERTQNEIRIGLPQDLVANLIHALEGAGNKMAAAGYRPVLLVNQAIRPVISELLRDCQPRMHVLGHREVQGGESQILGKISLDQLVELRPAA